MFRIIKSAINLGGYKLAEMTEKIKKMFVLGDITETEMDELLTLMTNGASADAERPETFALITALSERIDGLETRIKMLEGGETEDGDETTAYPAWEPWDGISNNYQTGAIVTHNGTVWISTFGGQNVWEPGTVGTETMWVEYAETDATVA